MKISKQIHGYYSKIHWLLTGLSALVLAASPPAQAATTYTLINIGSLAAGTDTIAYGLNSQGEVVGQSGLGAGHAFLYNGSSLQDLGTFAPGNAGQSLAFSINDNGLIVGYAAVTNGGNFNAFLSDNGGALQNLGTLGTGSVATAINNTGQIVGFSTTGAGDTHAASFSAGASPTDLDGRLGATSRAYGIGSNGTVIGEATTGLGISPLRAISTSISTPGAINFTDLGAGDNSTARGINAISSRIVGQNGSNLAFFTTPLTIIGALAGDNQGVAFAVNNAGDVVGESDNTGKGTSRAFFSPNGGPPQDINTFSFSNPNVIAGYTLVDATAINNFGQILVIGFNASTKSTQSFLLTPTPMRPTISSVTPDITDAAPGHPDLTITLNGINYYQGYDAAHSTIVTFNGIPLKTTVISTRFVTAVIPGSYMTNPSGDAIRAVNPGLPPSSSQNFHVLDKYILSVTLSAPSVKGGAGVTGTVTFNAALLSPVTVKLMSSNLGVASVPSTVIVPAGKSAATFPVTTSPVAVDTSVRLTASYNSVSKFANLTVKH